MELRQARVGREFSQAVSEAVSDAKRSSPLDPVTVVVPSNTAGLSLRRLLGSGALQGQPTLLSPQGIANVSFTTPFQLAADIAGPALARRGTRPLTSAVLSAGVRHVLATDPGRFGAVAEHTATESALVRAYSELTQLAPHERETLAARGSPRASELLGFVQAVSAHLAALPGGGYHDEFAVVSAAADLVANGVGVPPAVILAAPYEQRAATIDFLAALARAAESAAVVGLTGDPVVDKVSVDQLSSIVGRPLEPGPVALPKPSAMVPAADADDEVRAVVRHVVHLAEEGASFDRIAVLHPGDATYARSLREHFAGADVPTAGPDHRRLADSMVGRLTRRILELAGPGDPNVLYSRSAVLELVEAAPLRGPEGNRLRSSAWEELSRRAGVVAGIADWREKLTRHIDNLQRDVDDPRNAERSAGFFDARRREQAAAIDLRNFVGWLDDLSDRARVGRSWSERSGWLADVLDALLPPESRRADWPDVEVRAAEQIAQILVRVSVLDTVQPDASFAAFVRAVELELDTSAGSRGAFGTGVLVSSQAGALGLDVDHVVVVGLTEGSCPRPIREDTLVPDADRHFVAGRLASRSDRLIEQRRRFLASVASGTRSAMITMPLGDHRNGRVRTPSRWWLEAMRVLGAPTELTTENWRDHLVDAMAPERSFLGAVEAAFASGIAVSEADAELQRAVGGLDARTAIVAQGARVMQERVSHFGPASGDLAGADTPPAIVADRAISPTRLQRWAECPRKYFLGDVLGVGEIEAADLIEEISALDRGTLWHEILEHFISEALPGGARERTGPEHAWTDADRRSLEALAEERFEAVERRGLTGRPLLWEITKEALRADLRAFLDFDNAVRAEHDATPDRVELGFGLPGAGGDVTHSAAEVELADGRTVRLHGFIDRVDVRRDGSPVVFDYKTGKPPRNKKALHDDPVVGGTRLQLGVYAEAARAAYGAERASAYYWHPGSKAGFELHGYEWTAERRRRFLEAVTTIVDGIDAGLFPPQPGEWGSFFGTFDNCRYCSFNRICSTERNVEHDIAVADPRLAALTGLTRDPEAEDDS